MDVSLNGDGGLRAASWLCGQQAAFPALRPLVLALKALLRGARLADVSQGGLGSFALALMVIAHLQEEEKVRACFGVRALGFEGFRAATLPLNAARPSRNGVSWWCTGS